MPPDDSTPLGDAMTRRFPQQKIPEPEPGSAEARQHEKASDIRRRPGLPDHSQPMAADLDEEAEAADQRSNLDRGKPPGKQRG